MSNEIASVLLVEDDQLLWGPLLSQELRRVGFQIVEWKQSLQEYLSTFNKEPGLLDNYDAFVLDVDLSGSGKDRSALEILKHIRCFTSKPVVVTTQFIELTDVRDDVVCYPNTIFVMKQLLRNALRDATSAIREFLSGQGSSDLGMNLHKVIFEAETAIIAGIPIVLFGGLTWLFLSIFKLWLQTGTQFIHPYILIILIIASLGLSVSSFLYATRHSIQAIRYWKNNQSKL